jgi:hypothetical protein
VNYEIDQSIGVPPKPKDVRVARQAACRPPSDRNFLAGGFATIGGVFFPVKMGFSRKPTAALSSPACCLAAQPWYFTARDGSPVLTIAGLWNGWHGRASGETLKSCAMVITKSPTLHLGAPRVAQ